MHDFSHSALSEAMQLSLEQEFQMQSFQASIAAASPEDLRKPMNELIRQNMVLKNMVRLALKQPTLP